MNFNDGNGVTDGSGTSSWARLILLFRGNNGDNDSEGIVLRDGALT